MTVRDGNVARGDLFAAALGTGEGSEQSGARPVLVVSNDLFNEVMPVLTIVPLTTLRAKRRLYPSEVVIKKSVDGLRADSIALCHQIRTIARSRLGRRIGKLEEEEIESVATAIRLHLSL